MCWKEPVARMDPACKKQVASLVRLSRESVKLQEISGDSLPHATEDLVANRWRLESLRTGSS